MFRKSKVNKEYVRSGMLFVVGVVKHFVMVKVCKPVVTHESSYLLKKIIEQEDGFYFMMENREETRLFEADQYRDFGLKEGDRVVAKTKKENCAGNMITFLQHPRYKAGEIYEFEVLKVVEETLGAYTIHYVVIGDEYGLKQKLRINKGDLSPDQKSVTCKVLGTVVGHLSLMLLL